MKLYLLKLAYMHLADALPTNIPVPGYVIQTDDGKNILIDTGFPKSAVENPQNTLLREFRWKCAMKITSSIGSPPPLQ